MYTDEELRKRARKAAEDRAGFYIHLGIYLAVNAFLISIWWFTGGISVFPWFIFVTVGWGIGIVAHGLGVFRGVSYVDRKTLEEYKKLKKQEEELQAAKA